MTSRSNPDDEDTVIVPLLVEHAHEIFRTHFGPEPANGACLYLAVAAIKAGLRFGIPLVLQAGSATFLRLPPRLDDGKPETLTHFSYVWTPPSKDPLRRPVLDGEPVPDYLSTRPVNGRWRRCLPEIHVWAGYVGDGVDPETQRLVDLSTFALKQQCQALMHEPWLTPDPPPYLWARPSEIPNGWDYTPNREATLLAAKLARLALSPGGIPT